MQTAVWEKTRWIDVHGIAPEDTPATGDTYALNKNMRSFDSACQGVVERSGACCTHFESKL
jgi:hypothetical protein